MGACGSNHSRSARARNERGLLNDTLTVATLNYSLKVASPLEHYFKEEVEHQEKFDNVFAKVLPEYLPNCEYKDWPFQGERLDKAFRQGRYSPLFDFTVGIQNNKFIARQAFEAKWNEAYEANFAAKDDYPVQEKDALRLYDLAYYHALLKWVYHLDSLDNVHKLSCARYFKRVLPLFEVSFMDEKRKLDKIEKYYKRLEADVLIFQNATEALYEYFREKKKHYISRDESGRTMILAKKVCFRHRPLEMEGQLEIPQETKHKIDSNARTAFMFIDQFLIVGIDLDDDQRLNQSETRQLQEGLLQLEQNYQDFEIVLAGCINSFLDPSEDISKVYYCYPEEENQLTVTKKPTASKSFMKQEGQTEEQMTSKDKVISTLPLRKGRIATIEGGPGEGWIPSHEHPFDHFVVWAQLNTNPQRQYLSSSKKSGRSVANRVSQKSSKVVIEESNPRHSSLSRSRRSGTSRDSRKPRRS